MYVALTSYITSFMLHPFLVCVPLSSPAKRRQAHLVKVATSDIVSSRMSRRRQLSTKAPFEPRKHTCDAEGKRCACAHTHAESDYPSHCPEYLAAFLQETKERKLCDKQCVVENPSHTSRRPPWLTATLTRLPT